MRDVELDRDAREWLLAPHKAAKAAESQPDELPLYRDARTWTIPSERAKNGKLHDVPLSDAATAVLATLPAIVPRINTGRGFNYLFTTTGTAPISGWSRAKRHLDARMLTAARAEAEERGADSAGIAIAPWTLHDLRRTAATRMQSLGVAQPVVEKILNHVSGSFAGVAGIYQRHEYAAEKRQALETWGRFVERLVGARSGDNVVAAEFGKGRDG